MIGVIENAILERLRDGGGSGGFGYSFATLRASPDDWDVLMAEMSSGVRAPAAWVGYFGGDSTVQEDGGALRVMRARFVLVVMSRSLRNGPEVRQAGRDALNVGSYQLLLDAMACLVGFEREDLDMMPLEAGKNWMIARTQKMREAKVSAFAIELVTDFWIVPKPNGDPAPFTHFHADWDVPPFGEGADGDAILPIPNPDNADAADDVTLPGAPA